MNRVQVFKYNAFSGGFYYVVALLVMTGALWSWSIHYLMTVVLLTIFLAVFLLLCLRNRLVIDHRGITLTHLFKGDKFVGWDEIGDADGSAQDYLQSLPKESIVGSNDELAATLQQTYDSHSRRRMVPTGWEEHDMGPVVTVIGFVMLLGLCALTFYTYYQLGSMLPDDYQQAFRYTLIGKGNYEVFNRLMSIQLVVFAIIFIVVPAWLFKKRYLLCFSVLTVAIGFTAYVAYSEISLRKDVLENCSRPSKYPTETLRTLITENRNDKSQYMRFDIKYEGKDYEVKSDYLKGAERGMFVVVTVQKGAKGIPIIRDFTVDDVGYSLSKGYEPPHTVVVHTSFGTDTLTIKRRTGRKHYAHWSTVNEKPWETKTLVINDTEYGRWQTLESTSIDGFNGESLGMLIAFREDHSELLLMIGGYSFKSGYACEEQHIKRRVSTWFEQVHRYYTLIPNDELPGTWHLSKADTREFIRLCDGAINLVITCQCLDDGNRKDFIFAAKYK